MKSNILLTLIVVVLVGAAAWLLALTTRDLLRHVLEVLP